ncbi:hypothetical protein [Mesorhizobium sp. SP-1A]|uniref:hypothetical protein n=1 Tax=Mesorhizobium sp. SP-1A TaxID=3077840 RepID=UPI0028F6D0E0|nr:hypothetical protein [Mesorhizobium sp. SP-1A]
MRLFFKGNNCWFDKGVFADNMPEDELKAVLRDEILKHSSYIRDTVAIQGNEHSLLFPEDFATEPENLVRAYRYTEAVVRAKTESWRTINSYDKVQYSLAADGCCRHCGGTGRDPSTILSCCAYCDGTKVQIRKAIPENFMQKPLDEHTFAKKEYEKWLKRHLKLREALAECRQIE